MLAFLVCLGVVAILAVSMYKRKLLHIKKNQAADSGVVSFHGNVISFSNPVLDQKHLPEDHDADPIEYNLSQLNAQAMKGVERSGTTAAATKTTTTTFSNPVYELETDDDTPSTSRMSTATIASSLGSISPPKEKHESVILFSSEKDEIVDLKSSNISALNKCECLLSVD